MSVIFIGTGVFGIPILETLAHDERIKIPLVVSAQDKAQGRKLVIKPTPIKEIAQANKLIIQQPKFIEELKQKFIQEKPDFSLVVSYGALIKKDILEIPKVAAINIHASLLPKYRGASPIQEAILQGEKKTGITWIKMNEKMDAGDIIAQKEIAIDENDTSETLAKKLSQLAAQTTPHLLSNFIKNPQATKQNEEKATYCRKIKSGEGLLSLNKETAQQMLRKIRAYTPWPGCFIFWHKKRIKIVQAQLSEEKMNAGEIRIEEKRKLFIGTSEGVLEILKVHPAGKRVMRVEAFLRGIQ